MTFAAEALRNVLARRIEERCTERSTRQRVLTWLAELPIEEVPQQAIVVRAALADPRTATEALDAMRRYFTVDVHPRLTPAVRAAIVTRVSRADMTDTQTWKLVQHLRRCEIEEYEEAVAELLTPPEKPSLAGAHSVLVHALRAVPVGLWPPPPYHRGEVRPDIGAANYEVLARHLATRVDGELAESLLRSADKEHQIAERRADAAGGSLRPIVKKVAKALAEADAAACTAFLVAIDDELRRLDVVNALGKRRIEATAPIVRALWRGGHPTRVAIWIAELDAPQRCGIMLKLKSRFQWIEDTRDEVLAHVPDEHFESAVTAVLAAG